MKIGKRKEENGITLIALVLTIIVLLILAGVALNLVLGEDGITNRAITAGKTHNISGAKEKLELDVANYASEFYQAKYVSGDSSATSLKDYILERIVTGEDYTVDEKNVTTGEFQISIADGTNANGTVDQDGSVSWNGMSTEPVVRWTQTGTSVTNGTITLTVGSAVTGYSVTVDETTYGDGSWFVLGAKDGKLLITTNKNVDTVTLSGRTGYSTGVDTLNAAVASYKKDGYADKVWALNVDDINRVTGYNPDTENYGTGNLYAYGNKVKYYWDGTDKPYYYVSDSLKGNLSSSHDNFYYPDANGWANPAKSTTIMNTENMTRDSMAYITELTSTSYYYQGSSKIDSGIPAYTLLFANTGNYPGGTGSYWLGSPYVYCYTGYAGFGLRFVYNGCVNSHRLASSYGDESSVSMGCRPAVSLASDIQITSAGVISK